MYPVVPYMAYHPGGSGVRVHQGYAYGALPRKDAVVVPAPGKNWQPKNKEPAQEAGAGGQQLPEDFCFMCHVIGQPLVTPEGFLSMQLNTSVGVDLSPNKSLLVRCGKSIVLVNNNGTLCGLVASGIGMFQEGLSIDIDLGKRLARMSKRGVCFTSRRRTLVYLVDESGCKTTTETFRQINRQFVYDYFMNDVRCNCHSKNVLADFEKSNYSVVNNDFVWDFPDLRVKIKKNGDISVTKDYGKIHLLFSPRRSLIKVFTPVVNVLINRRSKVIEVIKLHRHQEQRLLLNHANLKVKCGSQKAGLDSNDQISLV